VEDIAHIGSRHETSRAFYLSLITALTAFLALAGKEGALVSLRSSAIVIVGLAGIAICLLWALHMVAYRALYGAKFRVVAELEKALGLPVQAYAKETEILRADWRAIRLTVIDTATAVVFAGLFVALILCK
jgi:hypothetical protein